MFLNDLGQSSLSHGICELGFSGPGPQINKRSYELCFEIYMEWIWRLRHRPLPKKSTILRDMRTHVKHKSKVRLSISGPILENPSSQIGRLKETDFSFFIYDFSFMTFYKFD